MLKKLLCLLFTISIVSVQGQVQSISSQTVGGTVDYTVVPFAPQASTSHSQTIYYPEDLQFRGTINAITYFMAFSSVNWQNSGNYIIKIGMTPKEEFVPGDNFIPAAELTEVFNNGTVTTSGLQMIFALSQSFYYDGLSNLVIDVQETMPGSTSSGLAGFSGFENFGNPPTRSMINIDGSILYENSSPKTKFGGTLERCQSVGYSTVTNLSPTSVSINWLNTTNIPAFRYSLTLAGEPIPNTYTLTSGTSVTFTDLIPATTYSFNRKVDCDITHTHYASQQFTTRPAALTVPSIITFDGVNNHNYLLDTGYYGTSELSALAGANGSAYGILFRGPSNYQASWDWDNTGEPFASNQDFITTSTFSIDLTNYTGNPVFKFDLRQTLQSHFRVKVGNYYTDTVYTSLTPSSDEFHTVTIDLSDKVGTAFDIVMEHVSQGTSATNPTSRTAFVDNVKLQEVNCVSPDNLTATATEQSITLNWQSQSQQWEVACVYHDQSPPVNGIPATASTYTFTNLLPAKSYDVYVRSKCSAESSAWKKIIKSTLPVPVQVPYEEAFSNSQLNNHVAPQFNEMSHALYFTSLYPYTVVMLQKDAGVPWIGGDNTTEAQAWNDNKEFVTGLKFRVDATNLLTLQAVIKLRQQYYYSYNTAWYRITSNGQQFGPSRHPSQKTNEPYVTFTYDLTQFVGQIVDITFEHCGRETDDYLQGGIMEITQIDNVIFTGETDPNLCSLNLIPIPAYTAECSVESTNIIVPVVTDSCGNEVTGVTDSSVFPITAQGTTAITWTFTHNGNTFTQVQNVIINDITQPLAVVLEDLFAYCSLDGSGMITPTTLDNCTGELTATTATTFPISALGENEIIWTFNDGHGNATTVTQLVHIYDNMPPTVMAEQLPNVISECVVELEDLTVPYADDDCGGLIAGTTTTVFPVTSVGTTMIQWDFIDSNNNITSQTQNIVITGNEPQLQLQDLAVGVDINGVALLIAADFDNGSTSCGAIESWAVFPQSFNCSNLGINTVIVTASDTYGNIISGIANVTITDAENYCETAGIQDVEKEQFVLYPNPVYDVLYINAMPEAIQSFTVYSIMGQELYHVAADEHSGNYKLGVGHMAAGTYILKIETDKGIRTQRFIKH